MVSALHGHVSAGVLPAPRQHGCHLLTGVQCGRIKCITYFIVYGLLNYDRPLLSSQMHQPPLLKSVGSVAVATPVVATLPSFATPWSADCTALASHAIDQVPQQTISCIRVQCIFAARPYTMPAPPCSKPVLCSILAPELSVVMCVVPANPEAMWPTLAAAVHMMDVQSVRTQRAERRASCQLPCPC